MAASSVLRVPPLSRSGAESDAASEAAALHEYDLVEWGDVCRKLVPGITQQRIESTWEAFQRVKARGFVLQ